MEAVSGVAGFPVREEMAAEVGVVGVVVGEAGVDTGKIEGDGITIGIKYQ